jgi:voltage-gated potassium channel
MTDERLLKKRLASALIFILSTFIFGTVGYQLIEGWNFLDSFWMTVITLTSVGYGEIHPLSRPGRVFTIGLIFLGIGIIGYGLGIIATFVVEGGLGRLISQNKMQKEIEKLNGHIIICGMGETGYCVAREFLKTNTPFVAIELQPGVLERVTKSDNFPYIEADATKDATLLAAGIDRAQGLISTLHNDRDNLFVVLTARFLNSRLRIVSRVVEPESEHKLLVAGANSVISPNLIGGMRMASVMIRPTVVNFLDVMLRAEHATVRLEEVKIAPTSKIVGKQLRHSGIRELGVIVIAIKGSTTNQYSYNPQSDSVLLTNDTLVVMGEVDQIGALRKVVEE